MPAAAPPVAPPEEKRAADANAAPPAPAGAGMLQKPADELATGAAPERENLPAPTLSAKSAPARDEAFARAAAPLADSARPRALALNQVIVTGAGTAVAREKSEPSHSLDSATPPVVSRNTATESGDTVVTTIYDVHGVRVTLMDRSPNHVARRSATNFSDAVMARARASVPSENSITWSDSTGRTRTLRGALSSAELERLKAELFGATP
jgi:hypothetical protein